MNRTRRGLLAAGVAGLVAAPGAGRAQSRRGATGDGAGKEGPPLARSESERLALPVLDDISRNQRHLNVRAEDGRLLRVLAESIGAKQVVEIGTSTGYSGLWLALALRATGGRLTTFEIDAGRAAMAQENFKRAQLQDLVTLVLGDAHEEVVKVRGPIDLLFIDADKEGYVDYLEKLAPKVRPGGLIVSDNMQIPAPDPRYVRAITTDPSLETLFLSMHGTGVGLTLKKH